MTRKIGILGLAHGHYKAYCRRWKANPELGVEVAKVWDHDGDRRRQGAENLGCAACSSPEEMLNDGDVEAVLIAAETAHHADLVERAAGSGKAIILQKPMALTMAEADRVVTAVEQAGARFTMAWQMRVDPQNLEIRRLIKDGDVGRVFMFRRRHGLSVCLRPEFATQWHMDPAMNRDIWADDAAHPIDLVYWLFGMPRTVTAEIEPLHDPKMPMDNGIAVFRYPDGPLVEVCCSFTNLACENTTEVIGEKGSIVQNYGDVPSCNVPKPEDAVGVKWFRKETGEWMHSDIPVPGGHGERIEGLAPALAEFIHGTRGPIATAGEGRDALRMTLACYVSAREGRRVNLDDPAIVSV